MLLTRSRQMIPTLFLAALLVLNIAALYSNRIILITTALLLLFYELVAFYQKQKTWRFHFHLIFAVILFVKLLVVTKFVHYLTLLAPPSLSLSPFKEYALLMMIGTLFIWMFTYFIFMRHDYAQLRASYETLRTQTEARFNQGIQELVTYTREKADKEHSKQLLVHELQKALQKNELTLHYQPQIELQTGQIVGFEALIRWHHPKRGFISPAEFIPTAEESGLIIPIGKWVLQQACLQAKQWHQHGYCSLKVGVNLSPLQFSDPNLVQLVANTLQECKLPPHALDLEITEGIAMHNENAVIEKLSQLQQLGVTISIDDFGTGYSSLSYLAKYPIQTLKIAREFIQEIEHSEQREAIISSMITMAKNLHLTVIAEGVETEAQQEFLRERQCDQIQGFFVSKPVEAEQAWKLLLQQKELAG